MHYGLFLWNELCSYNEGWSELVGNTVELLEQQVKRVGN